MRSIKDAKMGDVFRWSKDNHFIMFLCTFADDPEEFIAVNLTSGSDEGIPFDAGDLDPYLPHDDTDPERLGVGGWEPVDTYG